jgi:anaerobic magnesium-protoporphyrin IX monomethyl ester cyclase
LTDLVLVNPNHRNPSPYAAVEPPLWLGLMAGDWARFKDYDVRVVDAEAEGLTVAQTVARVAELQPKETIIVCMGANPSVSSTPKWPVTLELLKHLDAKVTGLHPTATGYPGAISRPFDGTPTVPWHLLPMHLYRAHNWHCLGDLKDRGNYAVLYTSLNCPHNCSYCNVHALYGNRRVRYRPMEDIKAELDKFAEMGIRNIKVWDELFCLDEKRVAAVCNHIIGNGYKFNIWAYARTDSVSLKMLTHMSLAGIHWVAYGFESVKDKKSRKAREAIDMTRASGVNIMGNFIFGLPGETEDTMKASLDFAMKENFEYVNFNIALPYPGSEWYDSLKVKPTDWSTFDQFSPNICADPKVVAFRDAAFQQYFGRKEYLTMIAKKFGVTAATHIADMTQWGIRNK